MARSTPRAGQWLARLVRAMGWPVRRWQEGPWPWLLSCYLTLLHVDSYERFPAIRLHGRGRLRIEKHRSARLDIPGRLEVRGYLQVFAPSTLTLAAGSTMVIEQAFTVGDDVRILVGPRARLEMGGSDQRLCGITGRSSILVRKHVRIGRHFIASWSTFVTDSDWHRLGGEVGTAPTVLADRVWLCPGSQVLKGVRLGEGSIVAANAVVLAGDYPARSLLSGTPARVVAQDLPEWDQP